MAKIKPASKRTPVSRKKDVARMKPAARLNSKSKARIKGSWDSFQVSGVIGGTSNFTLNADFTSTRQQIAVIVPCGEKLVLKRTRFCFGDAKNRFVVAVLGGNRFQSASSCAEEKPNFVLFENTGTEDTTVLLVFAVHNASTTTSTVFQSDGWQANFEID
ncbi:hypothetical protein [Paenibacillus sp. MBLB4367]|uniref:hypothetical protein n=1 Tax=Paenibacillus sp. MBLB4367 TaxID=3384767 RepID=UPI003908132C